VGTKSALHAEHFKLPDQVRKHLSSRIRELLGYPMSSLFSFRWLQTKKTQEKTGKTKTVSAEKQSAPVENKVNQVPSKKSSTAPSDENNNNEE
jgi:hypothetical protein